MLQVSEIFGPTIQGEGRLTGNPSIFIRFALCNMQCEGFKVKYNTSLQQKKGCDSYYSVDKSFKDKWLKISFDEIIKRVKKLEKTYKVDIVITGGEPLLYWYNKEFQKILQFYVENNYQVTIETNASLNIEFSKAYQKKIIFSMSVKLSNSLEPFKKRINLKTLKEIIENTEKSYFKFVIFKKYKNESIEEIKELISKLPKIEVYLMPAGETIKQINKNSKASIKMAIKNGFKYCDRVHIRIWNNKKGV